MADLPADFAEQLLAFLPNLRRFAISLCRSGDMADDLVQSACERALASAASFRPGSRFDAWMFRILRNLWIDRLRQQRRGGGTEDIDDHRELAGSDGMRLIEARSTLAAVRAAIARLPDEQREVLLLVCVEGLSYADTAAVLDIPIGTVMSRLARARIKLAAGIGITAPPARSSEDGRPAGRGRANRQHPEGARDDG